MPYADLKQYARYQKEYQRINSDRLREYSQRYYQENKEVLKERSAVVYKIMHSTEEKRETQRIYRRNLTAKHKQRAVDYRGGKCVKCGYNNCLAALEFHHIDPTAKQFSIAASLIHLHWESQQRELDKCILLCNRCHREVHNGLWTIKDLEVK